MITSRADKAHAVKMLHDLLKPGDTVYTILRHVSASGMSRIIDLYAIKDNQPMWLVGYMCDAFDWQRVNKNGKEGIKVTGVGMDMGFHIVYVLSRQLFPKGDASNKDGGYVLKQRWL